jgi:hypothetical protein
MKRSPPESPPASAPGEDKGELQPGDDFDREVRAWASMGMNVFLGLRFAVWGKEDPDRVAAIANRLLRQGLQA